MSFEALRERMIAELIGSGVLTDPAIEAAFRAVPREVFAPAGTPAELPYAAAELLSAQRVSPDRVVPDAWHAARTVLKVPTPWDTPLVLIRPGVPFTPAEEARAARLAELAELVERRQSGVAPG